MTRRMVVALSAALLLVTVLTSSASAACTTTSSPGPWYCDTANWCWFSDGQKERVVTKNTDCDGDGVADIVSYDIEEGSCCNL